MAELGPVSRLPGSETSLYRSNEKEDPGQSQESATKCTLIITSAIKEQNN